MADVAVSSRGVNFWFGEAELRKQILFDVTFDIHSGEMVLLTGPSGSGKTTMLTLIGGLRHVPDGELTVLGHEMQHATPKQLMHIRRDIGFIFQQHNLLPFLTAQQNVELMFELHPEIAGDRVREQAAGMLGRVGLEHRLDYLPAKLSGGQKQRVAIARALAASPKLVLADEPTASLDSVTGREVVELLQQLARDEGCPILMVTHDHRVLGVADRIIHMEDGRVREQSVKEAAQREASFSDQLK